MFYNMHFFKFIWLDSIKTLSFLYISTSSPLGTVKDHKILERKILLWSLFFVLLQQQSRMSLEQAAGWLGATATTDLLWAIFPAWQAGGPWADTDPVNGNGLRVQGTSQCFGYYGVWPVEKRWGTTESLGWQLVTNNIEVFWVVYNLYSKLYHRTLGNHQPVSARCCKGEGTVYLSSCRVPSLNIDNFRSQQLAWLCYLYPFL